MDLQPISTDAVIPGVVGLQAQNEAPFTPRNTVTDIWLDESSGAKAIDSSGRGNHGNAAGIVRQNDLNLRSGATDVQYVYDRNVGFPTSNATVTLANATTLVGAGSSFTILANVLLKATGNNNSIGARVISIPRSVALSYLVLGVDSLGRIGGGSVVGGAFTQFSGGTVSLNRWHVLGLTKTGNDIQLYLDGLPSGPVYTYAATSIPAAVGCWLAGSGQGGWGGNMGRLLISNACISPGEVRHHYYDSLRWEGGTV